MNTGTAIALVGGLAVVGGVVWYVTHQNKRPPVVATPKHSSGGSSSLGSVLSTVGSAVALGGSVMNLFGGDD